MSLLTISQNALREIGSFAVPSSIVGSTDPTAVQLLALAKRSLRVLSRDYKWSVFLTTHTFSTSNGTATYALPSDFGSFANLTQWDRTNDNMVEGPVPPARFEFLRSSGTTNATAWKYFRVAAGYFEIYPTPTATESIAYQYWSKYAISGKETYTDDSDAPLLDEDLLTIDLRWRFLQAKGGDYLAEQKEAFDRRDALLAQDGGRDAISFGGRRLNYVAGNVPDSGFGS